MIRRSIPAVGKLVCIIILTAFFTKPSRAGESPLQQVQAGMHELIYRLSRSIVTVEATRSASGLLPGYGGQAVQTTIGTGLVCDSAGHVLVTASQVAGFDHIQISGEDRSLPARVVAVDYANDLAILESSLPVGDPIQSFSDPGVCAGQMVLSLYAANGLRASPAIGFCAGCRTDGFLSFSLPVTPSASGGGVFDLSGRLLGVITTRGDLENYQASAIPSYKLPGIIKRLLTVGNRPAGFAGIATRLVDINPPLNLSRSEMTLTAAGDGTPLTRGVVVTAVLQGSPAARAGLLPGDLLLEIAGQKIGSPDDVARTITELEPSSSVACALVREDRVLTTHLLIASRPIGLPSEADRLGNPTAARNRSHTVDSLRELLTRLRDEVSKIERRLESID